MSLFPVFGKTPSGPLLQRLQRSPNYRDGSFHNLVPTDMRLKDISFFKLLGKMFNKPKDTVPPRPLTAVRTDLRSLPDDQASVVWFGHSSYLLNLNGTTILVDPVFSPNAAPVSFFAKAFPGSSAYGPGDMPDIDILIITHDHYDHLDYKTVKTLLPRVKHIVTSLGVSSHLEYWGFAPEKITALDWWETATFTPSAAFSPSAAFDPASTIDPAGTFASKPGITSPTVDTPGLTLTATPARHFSGRGFKRNTTLWSSFVLKTKDYNLFLGGDSGYEQHFKTIGDKYGPFDLALLECGQYGEHWPYIHMFPEQIAQAALDLRAQALLPVHWAKFSLALHPWNEPVRRLTAATAKITAAAAKNFNLIVPRIGETVTINQQFVNTNWWDFA